MKNKINNMLVKLLLKKKPKIQYEIWAADYFDYQNVEWNCYAIYTDKEQAETEIQKLRREVGGEHSIIKFKLQEKEVC